jgi:hypothetical protein
MNEAFGVKGCVHKLEQRKQRNQDLQDPLLHVRDLDSYDVEFSASGQVLLETSYTHSGMVDRCTRSEYDETGRLVRTVSVDGSGKHVASSVLTYSESKCIWVNSDAEKVTANGVSEYSGKHLISTRSFDNENRLRTAKSFEYSEGTLLKSDSLYYLPDGTVYEHWITDYNPEGRIRRTYGLKADGSPLGDGKYIYEYDQEGRRSKILTFNEFADDNVATKVTIYQYVNDETGNWIERLEYHMWRDDSYQSKGLTRRTVSYYGANSR